MSNYKDIAQQVVQNIGGKENVTNAWHCVTRLRFNLSDKEKVNIDTIKNIQGVMGAQFSGDQFQVIIGNTVGDVFEEVEVIVGNGGGNKEPENSNEGIVSKVFDAISGIFTPIVPALAGAGLLKGFLALSVILGVSATSPTYLMLYGLSDAVLYFFPFLLAVSAAEKFKTSKYLAMALAGSMMYPTYHAAAQAAFASKLGGEAAPTVWKLFNTLPVPLVTYSSSVIPIIFTVLLLKYVNNWVKKWMPKSLNLMFTPMVSLILVFIVSMVVIGPAGTYLGNFVGDGITWLFKVAGPFAGIILGGTFPLLVITGMHYSLVPIGLTNLAKNGYENMLGPVGAISNVAQSGAAFAVSVRSKNTNMKQIALSSGISASIGITEPAMYGVNLKLKRPFYSALIASGIASGFGIFMNIRSFGGGGMPGFLSIPAYISADDRMNAVWFAVSLVLSWILSFVITLVLGFEEEPEVDNTATEVADAPVIEVVKEAGEKHRIFAPMNGKLVDLKSVSDETFSSELVGKGIAIEASDENLYAPISGTVMMFPDSKHAVGILGDNGVEVLIHIGIDTVELGGAAFDINLVQGQRVEKGELLGTVDYDLIKEKGLETVTMVIVTNTPNYFDISPAQSDGMIFQGEEILHII